MVDALEVIDDRFGRQVLGGDRDIEAAIVSLAEPIASWKRAIRLPALLYSPSCMLSGTLTTARLICRARSGSCSCTLRLNFTTLATSSRAIVDRCALSDLSF